LEQIIVTAGFMADQGRILMAQRLPRGPEGGKWEFPGGKVEPGEDPRTGLCRELMEELGIRVQAGPVLDVVSTLKEQRQLIIIYIQCRIISGEIQTIDCQDFRWLTPAEITLLDKPESDERFWERWQAANKL
jgi:ADP-ribose pyrophosphatase